MAWAEKPENVSETERSYVRDVAVTLVDGVCGYTMEFAGSPEQHRDFYNELETDLLTAFARFRRRMKPTT